MSDTDERRSLLARQLDLEQIRTETTARINALNFAGQLGRPSSGNLDQTLRIADRITAWIMTGQDRGRADGNRQRQTADLEGHRMTAPAVREYRSGGHVWHCVCGNDPCSGVDCGIPIDPPRKKPARRSAEEARSIRAQAWATRRAKYGPRGNNGSYSRGNQ
jgi:hypothetical protein